MKNPDRLCRPSRVKLYQGTRRPRCNGGDGCEACWNKYYTPEAAKLRRAASIRIARQRAEAAA